MAEEKKTYKVETPLRFNGSVYHPDKEDRNTVKMTDKEAKPLLAIGAVSRNNVESAAANEKSGSGGASAKDGAGAKEGTDTKEKESETVERIAAIKDAIGKLEPENKAHWLKDGKTPEVKALEELLGFGITAEERNQAVSELQGDKE